MAKKKTEEAVIGVGFDLPKIDVRYLQVTVIGDFSGRRSARIGVKQEEGDGGI